MRFTTIFVVTLLFSAAAFAETTVNDLAKPPADATHLIISSNAGKHGDSWIWRTSDRTVMGRESMNLRGQVFEIDSAEKFGSDGLPATITVRGFTPQGDAGETFNVADGKAAWKSPIDTAAPRIRPRRFTLPSVDRCSLTPSSWSASLQGRTNRSRCCRA